MHKQIENAYATTIMKKNLYFSNSESNQMGKGNTKPPTRPPKQTNTYQKEFLAE